MQLVDYANEQTKTFPLAPSQRVPSDAGCRWQDCPQELQAALESEIDFEAVLREKTIADGPGSQEDSLSLEEQLQSLHKMNVALENALEELGRGNRDLEAANEELRLLNEELESAHEEMQRMASDLNQIGERYVHTLDQMPYAVALVGSNGKIQFWNAAAQRLFNLESKSAIGLELDQIPVQEALRQALNRKYRAVVERGASVMLRNQVMRVNRALHRVNVHFASLSPQTSAEGVLVMFVRPPAADVFTNSGEFDSFGEEAAS